MGDQLNGTAPGYAITSVTLVIAALIMSRSLVT